MDFWIGILVNLASETSARQTSTSSNFSQTVPSTRLLLRFRYVRSPSPSKDLAVWSSATANWKPLTLLQWQMGNFTNSSATTDVHFASSSATVEVNSSSGPTVPYLAKFSQFYSHSYYDFCWEEWNTTSVNCFFLAHRGPLLSTFLWYHTVTSPCLRPVKRTRLQASNTRAKSPHEHVHA